MGEEFEMVTGNADDDYQLPVHEQHLVHVRLDNPQYDTKTGAKLSQDFIQKFTPREFELSLNVGGFAQYKVTILHDPSKGAIIKNANPDYVAGDASNPESIVNNSIGNITTGNDEKKDVKVEGANEPWDHKFRKADYQIKYENLFGETPDNTITIPVLKEAIEAKLAEGDVDPDTNKDQF